MCEHIVKVENATRTIIEGSGNAEGRESDRHETSRVYEVKSAESTAPASSSRRTDASNRIDEPSECRVQLFERNELQASCRFSVCIYRVTHQDGY